MRLREVGRFVAVASVALTLGCATGARGPGTKIEAAEYDPWGIPEPMPRLEPLSTTGNPPSYVVSGRTYYVRSTAQGYVESGEATWYGPRRHDQRTASGETFDMYRLSAAHPTLPLPSYVRVTNRDNGRELVVRVNDRGAFSPDRLIELSWAAAARLDMTDQVSTPVTVRGLVPESVPDTTRQMVDDRTGLSYSYQIDDDAVSSSAPSPASVLGRQAAEAARQASPGAPSYLQIGAYPTREQADSLVDRLTASGIPNIEVRQVGIRGRDVYRVFVGPFADDAQLYRARAALAAVGYTTVVFREGRPLR